MEGQANESGGHSQSDQPHIGTRTRAREVGRTLAHIGDNLNQEMRARQTVRESSTTVFVFQLANLRGVSMSFFIPIRVSFHYEADISLLVYIISFYTGMTFIPVRDG